MYNLMPLGIALVPTLSMDLVLHYIFVDCCFGGETFFILLKVCFVVIFLGVAVLQSYAEKKLHVGPTSDPNHQVATRIMYHMCHAMTSYTCNNY